MLHLLARRATHCALAFWLGVATPLLCVPGLSSNHEHGPHLALMLRSAPAADSHAHAHASPHEHAPPGGAPLTEPADGPSLTRSLLPTSPEALLANAFGLVPAFLSLALAALWIGRTPVAAPVRLPVALPPPWHPPRP